MQGTYVGALFHGQCEKCKIKYFPNYKFVFHTQLLKDIACISWVSGATFQSHAKGYNLNFRESDSLRLSELQEFARTNDE